MTIQQKLTNFYIQNNLDKDGGENNDWFYLHFKFFSLKLPNSQFRKDIIHIHDIEHILYNCDTTWKGEAFIAGWEIATGLWKKLPIGIMSLWAMGFSLLIHSKEVIKGYKEGLVVNGVINLDIEKEKLLQLTITQVEQLIRKEKPVPFHKLKYILFCTFSILVVITPILLLLFLWVMYIV